MVKEIYERMRILGKINRRRAKVMCGRFLFDADFDEVYNKLMVYERDYVIQKRDFRPSDQVPAIHFERAGNVIQPMVWGLKGYPESRLLINARRETLLEKPRYRQILDNRCVIPATSFYEPENKGKKKIMHNFGSGKIIYLAGLYEKEAEKNRVTIITMAATGAVKSFHDRMPVTIEEADLGDWLRGNRQVAYQKLLCQDSLYELMDQEVQISFF